MTKYAGICIVYDERGVLDHVVVDDGVGVRLTLEPADYESRGIQPPIQELPICKG